MSPPGTGAPEPPSGEADALHAQLLRFQGIRAKPRPALDPVHPTLIRQWCEAFEDSNPLYLDPEAARKTAHGRLVAPPAMLDVWMMPGQAPRPADSDSPFARVLPLLDEAGFTGVVATNAVQEYDRYLAPGDHLTAEDALEEISPRKQTALGEGYFVTTTTEFRDASGEPVGRMRFRILKFRPREDVGGGAPAQAPAPAARRPRPAMIHETRFFWEGLEKGELRIQACRACGTLRHPPVVRCPACGSFDLGHRVASGRGHVYSFVEIHHPPIPPFEYPLPVVLVELEEGTRLIASVAGIAPEELRVGLPVEVGFEEVEPELTLPVFRPRRPPRREEPLRLDEIRAGERLAPCPVPITATLIVAGAIATRDFTPVHHDREAARRQGVPDIFMNILSTNALCSRYATDWAGPDARLRRLDVRLGVPNFPGDLMVLRGEVQRVDPPAVPGGAGRVELAIRGTNRLGDHAVATAELELPVTPGAGSR